MRHESPQRPHSAKRLPETTAAMRLEQELDQMRCDATDFKGANSCKPLKERITNVLLCRKLHVYQNGMQQTLREITLIYLLKERTLLLFTSFFNVPFCYKYMYIKIDHHLYTMYFNYFMFLYPELLITLVIWIYLENIQMEWIPPHPPPHQKSPSQQATSERWGFGSISMYLIIKNTCSKNLLKNYHIQ